jgi:ADP-heptose:LPS heptosyltransferase
VPALAVTAGDVRAAGAALDGLAGPLVVVHPGASDARRCWPAERFAAVADALAACGATVAVVGAGSADARAGAELRAATRRPVLDLVGRLDLPALVGVLSRAELVLANDSGPRHLAAAVGTPTVGVWLAGNLVTAGPLDQDRHAVAVSPRTTCPVCGRVATPSGCGHAVSHVTDVAVDEVLDLALSWWDQAVAA